MVLPFYYKYANECGFNVRSSTTKSQKNKDDPTGVVMSSTIMKELCSGFENVRGSNNDFKKISRDLKVYISNADGAMHLTRVFWADTIGRRDYQLFGDSLSFDSTYDTNKYSLAFCPFTGVDNHKRCVTNCAALLSKVDIDSFLWLFQTFLKCMGREPSCIITNQYPTMGIALEKVFTKTKHRLCMWHIMRKVPEKVGTAFCNETDFLKKLSVVVWDREIDPHVFVDGWNSVMEEFDLVDHEWFAYMFKIKHIWIPAYFRDLFMGGILRSTSRSEGENNFFCNFTNPHVTCVEFFVRCETALDAQRHEQDELFRLNKLGLQLVTHLHLEKHAAVVYTRAIFYDFQEECEGAYFSCGVESCSSLYGDGVEYSIIVDREKRKIFYNRWRKNVLKKASVINVALDDASKYDKKKQLKMISKNNPENAPSSKEVKDADIQILVGSNEVDVNILPPNQCLNKGSARSSKRLKSVKEIALLNKNPKRA
ncbi:protein FAR1-RELATED SEQUENCE 5-like [Chenopodium quinoa]|uniref:protein FAR1-RELATED SEQUENCE 5-like n=1 Tax=Chenopodium quinoa TaxID=63459 RepID=UPI000B7984E7|nr:protein FAR1-RELATED SEQUENCE 5-like [Chenopodium quinoa]